MHSGEGPFLTRLPWMIISFLPLISRPGQSLGLLPTGLPRLVFFLVFANQPLRIVGELAGGGSVTVAVAISDR